MTPVMPRTNMASSRIAKAGVDTGAKMLGVGARPSAAAPAVVTKAPMALALHVTRDAIAIMACCQRAGSATVARIRSDQPDVAFDGRYHRVHPAAQHLLGKAKSEALDRMERNMRRQGEGKWIYHGIDHDGPVLVRKRFSKTLSNVARFFDANSFCAHRLGVPGEIRVLE